jgi:hypothetical protein
MIPLGLREMLTAALALAPALAAAALLRPLTWLRSSH